jgi:hypothetical protein
MKKRKLRKVVAYCPRCEKVNGMACADTWDEVIRAAKDAKMWKKEGRKVVGMTHRNGDTVPEWCECNTGKAQGVLFGTVTTREGR